MCDFLCTAAEPAGFDSFTDLLKDLSEAETAQLARLQATFRTVEDYTPFTLAVRKHLWDDKVDLSVQFMDNPPADLRARILSHMNAWGQYGNVRFRETASYGDVRVDRSDDNVLGKYWSYVGKTIRSPSLVGKPTMNLGGFTMAVPEREFRRVVRHEAGHTLGFAHEHLRAALVKKIDRQKAIDYFIARNPDWNADKVVRSVLTPVDESIAVATSETDAQSIMCYHIPGEITVDGKPIKGGSDISPIDQKFCASCYPLS